MHRQSILGTALLLIFQLINFSAVQAQSFFLEHNGESSLMDHFESGNLTQFPWENDDFNSWTVVSTSELQGQYAARSATPTYSGIPSTSTLTLTVDLEWLPSSPSAGKPRARPTIMVPEPLPSMV